MSEQVQPFLINNEYGTGYLPDLGDFRDFSPEMMLAPQQIEDPTVKEIAEAFTNHVDIPAVSAEVLPSTSNFIDLMPPVRNQGSIGSCTAFSVDGIVSYYNKTMRGRTIPISTLYTYKKSRDLDYSTGDVGSYLRTAMKSLKMYGWIEEKRYPYIQAKYDNVIPRDLIDYGVENQAISYVRIDSKNQPLNTLVNELKKYVIKKIPIMFGFSVYSSINQANTNGGLIPYPTAGEKLEGGHAVVIVGYDDNTHIINRNSSNATVKGGFIIRNSWSNRWGKNGYGILPYKYVENQLAMDFWSLLNLEWLDFSEFD